MSHQHTNWKATAFDPRYEACGVPGCRALRHAEVLLDPVGARIERDKAVERVAEWSEADWARHAYDVGKKIAFAKTEFVADDFWRAGLPKPREPRALGPILLALQRDGFIEATDRLVNTAQVLRHAAPVRVWRSRVRSEVA